MVMSIRILIADDHAVFRSGLRVLLEKVNDFEVVGEAGTGLETIKLAQKNEIDLLLLDINMPEMNGPVVAEEIVKNHPEIAIIILTMHDDEYYFQELFKIGVRGFVLKKSTGTDLIQAIRAVIPAIVGQFIALFKDTTLFGFIAILELLNISRSVLGNLEWRGTIFELYVFIGVVFWILCYSMSAISRRIEKRLGVGER